MGSEDETREGIPGEQMSFEPSNAIRGAFIKPVLITENGKNLLQPEDGATSTPSRPGARTGQQVEALHDDND